jgi:hypothetical protein
MTSPVRAETIRVPSDYPTIQEGVDHAAEGDTVLVADGTYKGLDNKDIDFKGIDMVVTSENGRDHTIIDCERSGRGFHIHSGETEAAVINGFTIKNGLAGQGAGIFCQYSSTPVISFCTIEACSAYSDGGAINNNHSGAYMITECNFHNNSAYANGGGVYVYNSPAIIINCTFNGNSARYGGAISTWRGKLTASNLAVMNNRASSKGGGCYFQGAEFDSIDVTNCTITNNVGPDGGGISIYESKTTISECLISENSSCGIEVFQSSPIITHCTITNNEGYSGGGINFSNACGGLLSKCVISGNYAEEDGGGINCDHNTSTSIINCNIVDNIAVVGGGIYIFSSWPSLFNCTVADNSPSGYHVWTTSAPYRPGITNTIIWGNSPYSIQVTPGGLEPDVTYSDIQGGYSGFANLDVNPDFIGGGNYHLSSTSLVIDKGTSSGAPSDDIDGDTRPQSLGYDMGSDEVTNTFVEDEIHDTPDVFFSGSMAISPNPFNPVTRVNFVLNRETDLSVKIYSLDGRLVKTLVEGWKDAGSYSILWDGTGNSGHSVCSGVYICLLLSERETVSRKLILLK